MALYFCSGELKQEQLFKHYALNVPLYTHFTSPIRRYADIIVHRLLASSLSAYRFLWTQTYTHTHTYKGDRASCQMVLWFNLADDQEEKCKTEQSSLWYVMLLLLPLPLFVLHRTVWPLFYCLILKSPLILNISVYLCMQNVDLTWACRQQMSRNRHHTVMTRKRCPRGSRSSARSSSLASLLRWGCRPQLCASMEHLEEYTSLFSLLKLNIHLYFS